MPSPKVLKKLALYGLLAMSLTGCAVNASLQRGKASKQKSEQQSPEPVLRAHSHNDYLHDAPFYDAWNNGFVSVEADIFLEEDKLLVAHTQGGTRKGRTLEGLYLRPMREMIQKNGGNIYSNSSQAMTLLIDIKTGGLDTYKALHHALEKYEDMLTVYDENGVKPGVVNVLISGNCPPKAYMNAQKKRYAGYDGRLPDLQKNFKNSFMPMVSANWGKNFKWDGKDEMPESERAYLYSLVSKAHENGQQIRFWNTPEKDSTIRKAVWKELVSADVDFINTDHLPELHDWLIKNDVESPARAAARKTDLTVK